MDGDAAATLGRVRHGGASDPEVLDFSANTNPERPPGVESVYRAAFGAAKRYPDDDYPEFRRAAADYVGCDPAQVVPTAGATVGLRLAIGLAVDDGDDALLPRPSFGEYAREVRLAGGTPAFVDHDAILRADPEEYALAVVCNPNNPTGEAADDDALRGFAERCREAGTTLLVDEAFLDFTDRPSLGGEPGVVVARSLTKLFGLPGIRAGFLVATNGRLDRLEGARAPWELSTPAAAVGTHCLRQDAFVEATRERVAAERARLRRRLESRFDVFPSDAPFLLFDTGPVDPDALIAAAREAGIAVRDARSFATLDSHLRVAVRRPAENDRLLGALDV